MATRKQHLPQTVSLFQFCFKIQSPIGNPIYEPQRTKEKSFRRKGLIQSIPIQKDSPTPIVHSPSNHRWTYPKITDPPSDLEKSQTLKTKGKRPTPNPPHAAQNPAHILGAAAKVKPKRQTQIESSETTEISPLKSPESSSIPTQRNG